MNDLHRLTYRTRILFCSGILAACTGLAALPPWIALEQRVRESDVVMVGKIRRAAAQSFSGRNRAGSLVIRRVKTYKGNLTRADVHVSFLMTDGMSAGKISELPKTGTYIFFLKRQRVKDASGRSGTALVLYRPHLFSFADFTPENVAKVKAAIQR